MHRSKLALTAVAGLLVISLAGCGAGRDPETYRERRTVDAAIASLGELELRNVTIVPPEAGEAEVGVGRDAFATLSIVNMGERPDRLVQVSTPGATSVEMLDDDGRPLRAVAIGRLASVGPETFTLAIRGLTAALRPGQHLDMTFVFANNGRRTLVVPMGVYTSPAPAPEENPFEEHEG